MCKDKSNADDKDVISASHYRTRVEKLIDDGALETQLVPLKKVNLAKTAPFHQSCRAHIGKRSKI